MARRVKTPRRKQVQRAKSPTLEKPKANKVVKPTRKRLNKDSILKTPGHGVKTRARATKVRNQLGQYQKHNTLSSSPQTPKTPRLLSSARSRGKSSIWSALSTTRSFWATVKEAAEVEACSSAASSFDSTNIVHIARRLSASVSAQLDSYKYENHGFFSSSSPSGHDPRDLIPRTDDEVQDVKVAVWPTVQHVLELTHQPIRLPNPKGSYLDQIRHIRLQLRNTWQDLGKPSNAPPPFQLEAWSGGISRWRESTYTDGTARFSASIVEMQLEAWVAANLIPPPPKDEEEEEEDDNDGISSPEIFHARHEWNHNSTSPTLGAQKRRTRRKPMSAIYDEDRDVGFLPTPAHIHAYQAAGEAASTMTIPSLSMSDDTYDFDIDDFPPLARRRLVPIYEDRDTPPRLLSGDADGTATAAIAVVVAGPDNTGGSGSSAEDASGSDKENDVQAQIRYERAEREAEITPSSSQQAIDPVGERMVRSELLGEEWEVERGMGWGGGGGGGGF
ncbi:MAG: hypothetical protein Q9185_005886 [Variospora sp. 1 TL-2023]